RDFHVTGVQTCALPICKAISISLGLDACLNNGTELGAVHFLSNCDHVDVVVTASGGIAAIRSLAGPVASSEVPFDAANFCREVQIGRASWREGVYVSGV